MIYITIFLALVVIILFFKKPFLGLLFLIALIPFHAFLATAGPFWLGLGKSQILSYWKEFILAILFVRIVFDAIRYRRLPFKIIWVDRLIALLFVIALVSIIYGTKNLAQAGWGIRYDFEMFLIYGITRALIRDSKQIKQLFYVLLASGTIVAIFGLVQALFLTPDFLARCCGYSYALGWTPDQSLQASQVIPGADPGSIGSYRIISTFAGPNQLGIYLSSLILLAASAWVIFKAKKERLILGLLLIVFLVPLYFTYSRSAWLALIAGLITIVIFTLTRKYLIYGLIAIVGIIFVGILIIIFGRNNPFIENVLLRFSTSGDHWAQIKESLTTFLKHPFGLGVGKAGLVSMRFPKNGIFINESWHLQILTELGFLGFLVYVGIIYDFFRKLYKGVKEQLSGLSKTFVLTAFSILVAVIVHGFFLHTWTDISLVVIVWVIFAIAINISQNEIKEEV
jgi:O-antigen ligase